jgi:hypothetical protein
VEGGGRGGEVLAVGVPEVGGGLPHHVQQPHAPVQELGSDSLCALQGLRNDVRAAHWPKRVGNLLVPQRINVLFGHCSAHDKCDDEKKNRNLNLERQVRNMCLEPLHSLLQAALPKLASDEYLQELARTDEDRPI